MVNIIIPTWNNSLQLSSCLNSIFALTKAEYRITVICNDCVDNSKDIVKKYQILGYPISIIENNENLGFIKAVNQGIKATNENEHICLLNDDTIITDDNWLFKLHNNFNDSEIGAVAPSSNFVMGYQTIFQELPKSKYISTFLVFFCVLIRNETWNKVGLLDERFGLGGNDDIDYSYRITETGYKLLIDRTVHVFHYGGQSISRIGGYQEIEPKTRQQLIEKWGADIETKLFTQGKIITPYEN